MIVFLSLRSCVGPSGPCHSPSHEPAALGAPLFWVALGLIPPRPSVAFAYGFGRARVPHLSDPDFPAAFAGCVAKSRRPGRPSPPHTPHTPSSLSSYTHLLISQAGAKHQPILLPSRDRSKAITYLAGSSAGELASRLSGRQGSFGSRTAAAHVFGLIKNLEF